MTALGAAMVAERDNKVSLLLDQGADTNIVTSGFGTVLGQAIYTGNTKIAFLLLKYGADVMYVGGSYSIASGIYTQMHWM